MSPVSRMLIVTFAVGLTLPLHAGAPKMTLHRKLAAIVLPTLSFEEAKVKDVFEYIKREAKRLDVDDEGINLMFACKADSLERTVSLEFTRIPLGEAIRYICMGSDLGYRVERHAVVISDNTREKDRMEMRVYHIDAGVLDTRHKQAEREFNGD